MRTFAVVLVAIVAIAAATPVAVAQPSDSAAASKVPIARRLYDDGVEAVNKGRWSVAYEKFKGSYELAPRVLTLFNLAGAEAQTSRFVEASESYRRFLRETADGRYPDLRADATNQLETLEKQISQLKLAITNLGPGDEIRIDRVVFPAVAMGEPIPLNPGDHTVTVTRQTAPLVTRTIKLAPGAAQTLAFAVPAGGPNLQLQQDPAAASFSGSSNGEPVDDAPRKESGGLLRSPWFWTAMVVVAAGAVTAGYFLTRPGDDVVVVR